MKQTKIKKWFVVLFFAAFFAALTVFCASAETEGIFTYTVSGNEATVTKVDYNGVKDIVIPETLGGYPVTTLANNALKDDEYSLIQMGWKQNREERMNIAEIKELEKIDEHSI